MTTKEERPVKFISPSSATSGPSYRSLPLTLLHLLGWSQLGQMRRRWQMVPHPLGYPQDAALAEWVVLPCVPAPLVGGGACLVGGQLSVNCLQAI